MGKDIRSGREKEMGGEGEKDKRVMKGNLRANMTNQLFFSNKKKKKNNTKKPKISSIFFVWFLHRNFNRSRRNGKKGFLLTPTLSFLFFL